MLNIILTILELSCFMGFSEKHLNIVA